MPLLYQDAWLVAAYKPAGLLVHRSQVDRGARQFLLQLLRDRVGQRVYPVHRLDRPTAGLIVFGLDPDSAGRMASAFAERRVAKRYLAVVRGWTDDSGRIDRPLMSLEDRYTGSSRGTEMPKEAITEYRTLARCELPYPVGRYATARYSLVEAHPLTGRQHQIRRHFNHISHPIIGDVNHGDRHHNRFFRQHFGCHRLLLLAHALDLPHPAEARILSLRTEPDTEFASVLARLGWDAEVDNLQNGSAAPI
ncbi:MAG: pseudouridylate synthase [Gammaproteobacteria bacterium]|nr:MAG: pseudouridylate synthase [Gammaproteobacteria bacterium]